MTPGIPLQGSGSPLLEECIRLLNGLAFDTDQGGMRDTEALTVSVRPRLDGDVLGVSVACYAHGHQIIDWNRLRVGVEPQGQAESLQLMPLLNARGQATLSGLTPGPYEIVAFHRVPELYASAAARQWGERVQKREAVLHATVGGQTIQSYQLRTLQRDLPLPESGLIVIDRSMPLLNVAGIQLTLHPDPDGILVTLQPAEGCAEHAEDLELCLVTEPQRPGVARPSVWQRVHGGRQRLSTTWQGTWPDAPDTVLEILYRLSDPDSLQRP